MQQTFVHYCTEPKIRSPNLDNVPWKTDIERGPQRTDPFVRFAAKQNVGCIFSVSPQASCSFLVVQHTRPSIDYQKCRTH
jgi:hypothetical protein